eukprot:m.13799 g.13799  ORF g.13799 m.13799 type:complete len:603 (+) comp10224_c1_seq2:313-2121(+)
MGDVRTDARVLSRHASSSYLQLYKACGDDDVEQAAIALAASQNNGEANILNQNNLSDYEGMPPLHQAARQGRLRMVRFLLDKGAEVNVKDKDGRTGLHWACYNGHTDTAELLIARGVEVDARTHDFWTALHYTAWKGYLDTSKLLIANGANVNAKSKCHNTPLHKACWRGEGDVAVVLILNGANEHSPSNDKELTPVQAWDTTREQLKPNSLWKLYKLHSASSVTPLKERRQITNAMLSNMAEAATESLVQASLFESAKAIILRQVHELGQQLSSRLEKDMHCTPLMHRSDYFHEFQDYLGWLHNHPLLRAAPTSSNVSELRSKLVAQQRHEALLAEQLRRASLARQDTEQQLACELQATHQQYTIVRERLQEVASSVAELQSACETAMDSIYTTPVSQMSLEQAHAFCCVVSDSELPFTTFKGSHDGDPIDGHVLTTFGERDFEKLFGLPIGIRHRLLHCIREAGSRPNEVLIRTAFSAAVSQLQTWLGDQEPSVPEAHCHRIAQARFDIVTCEDVTAATLGTAGIPIAARSQLAKLLSTVPYRTVPVVRRIQHGIPSGWTLSWTMCSSPTQSWRNAWSNSRAKTVGLPLMVTFNVQSRGR